ncbi:MAG: TraR/DksA C4-type zinc finger protein [Deltaproteobacteria bacterium]|nr:TraR/DksA C4-type zinc finger protein [Deltaproteobacteria bacterium]
MSRSTEATERRAALEPALLARRQQLIRQVARLEGDLDWLQANVESESLEEGQEQALAGVLEQLDEHDRRELAAIERALARMRRGEYARCEGCGTEIPLARQRALPAATFCRPCADAREALERP